MKKIGLLSLLVLMFFSCKKDKDNTNSNTTFPDPNPIDSVPSSFVRNVLIENFKGEWNPNCPTGDDSLIAMQALNQNRLNIACIHQGDWLSNESLFDSLNYHLGGITGFPRASINRMPATQGTQLDSTLISIFNWRLNILEALTKPAICGLALKSTFKDENLNLKVYIGYHDSINSDTRLTIYITEDSVSAQNQSNAPSGYKHHFVVRKVLTPYLGDTVNLLGGNQLIKEYSASLQGLYSSKSNLKIIAFVHQVGLDVKQHEVLNSQDVYIDSTKNWNE